MAKKTNILCFVDVLCVYCYISHARFAQIAADFGEQVQMTYHFRATYGDVRRRIEQSGKSESAYGAMVREAADQFEHVAVHPDVFRKKIPTSSGPAHLYLRSVKLLEDAGLIGAADSAANPGASLFGRMMWEVQLAFFRDLVDVSQRQHLDGLAERLGLPVAEIGRTLDDGRAYAELDHDAKLERRFGIQMTPALVLNDGRQVLNGNVGYRVIEANIRELLTDRPTELSWQ